MDPVKIIKFFTEHIADWSRVTLLTLRKPIARFELVPVDADGTGSIIGHVQSEKQLWLHPKLFIFALLSIVLGSTMNKLIQGRNPGPELFTSVVIILTLWIAAGSIFHLICLFLRGKGSYLETLSVFLQVSATLYVVTSFLSLLATLPLLSTSLVSVISQTPLFNGFERDPIYAFFLIDLSLGIIYLPLAMKTVHKFGWTRTAIIAAFPAAGSTLPAALYSHYGILLAGG